MNYPAAELRVFVSVIPHLMRNPEDSELREYSLMSREYKSSWSEDFYVRGSPVLFSHRIHVQEDVLQNCVFNVWTDACFTIPALPIAVLNAFWIDAGWT
jgi:hypothetical protein